MDEFKVGMIVQLKSGGPKMTIVEIDTEMRYRSINCHWFSGSKLEYGSFHPKSLIIIKEEQEK